MQKIDNYQILKSLGKGGMGEVFLSYDPSHKRNVALKVIRSDLLRFPKIQRRFLREALIAAQLTHPSIIPIYSICKKEENTYYTMPYIEGETLKAILRTSREEEQQGKATHPIGASIPTLARLFLNICQAIAYTHAQGILHRDIKPENIIVGKYGEVMLLDWGLADFINAPLPDDLPAAEHPDPELTDPGKVVGTITYLAPERALGEKASVLTDIYSLGAILYQILTLQLPFKRTSLARYKKTMQQEELIDPQEEAPYRDIPEQLSKIAKKCLAFHKEERYQTVEELIADLEHYIEGKPEWLLTAELDYHQKKDWEFHENVVLAKHIAITRETDLMEWVSLMISSPSFSGNCALETYLTLHEESSGLGFLLSVPEIEERKGFEEGYSLWIGSPSSPGTILFRSNIEVLRLPELSIAQGKVRIEKTDHNLRLYIDDRLHINYFSNLPMTGSKIGLLHRDDHFTLTPIQVFLGAQNVMVNCLAVPDAFLANKNFSKALSEYRRIGQCFRGRTEGWEALFRAGLTLIEEGSLPLALEEFEKLHNTPGAPLEYLGKSLVYKAEKEPEEEIKCLELALRKFAKHPLQSLIVEHIIFRLHEAAYKERVAAYHFALLAKRLLPDIFTNPDHRTLIASLEKHYEPLSFLEAHPDLLLIALGFWLAKPLMLVDMAHNKSQDAHFVANALFALLKLGEIDKVKENLFLLESDPFRLRFLNYALQSPQEGLATFFKTTHSSLSPIELRTLIHLFEKAIDEKLASLMLLYFEQLDGIVLSDEARMQCDTQQIWALLQMGEIERAGKLLQHYPIEMTTREDSPLFFLFGCYLWAHEGEEIAKAHFLAAPEITHPRTTALLGSYINGKITLDAEWNKNAFYWEKLSLERQLALFAEIRSLAL